MRQFRFRALVTLEPADPGSGALHKPPRRYPNHTRALSLAFPLRAGAGPTRPLPAEIWWDGDEQLRPGVRALVTARVSDDRADDFLDAGQRFTLWSGSDVGHGTVCRRVFTDYSPS